MNLNEAEKQKVANALNEKSFETEQEVLSIMREALSEQNASGDKFLDMMPIDLIPVWESLNEAHKASIIAQSRTYKLNTPYQINNFWRTRGLNIPVANVEPINESSGQKSPLPTGTGYTQSYVDMIADQLGKRFK